MTFRKFGTTLALLSLYLSLLILNNDKCDALKIVDRCFCKQRVRAADALNSDLCSFHTYNKKHIYTQPQACDSE